MPTYQYACTECGAQMEVVQSFTDDSLTVCPECEGRLRKVYSAVGIVFKGSGFYRTDSGKGSNSSITSASGENGKSDSSSTSSDSAKGSDTSVSSGSPTSGDSSKGSSGDSAKSTASSGAATAAKAS
ncbi:FmdB family zinc ribbon protein [Nocardiopsis sp. CNT312]|uniref:FmdB family zinc ribbon protein n=1 Tax=Nocardiopsis sp. CNT312 TaxID=1137268 RepID=UPI00048ABACC|nr:FmdB family zinc ribbon protein [Nocardiopsis sp. CNT312]